MSLVYRQALSSLRGIFVGRTRITNASVKFTKKILYERGDETRNLARIIYYQLIVLFH